MTATYIPLATIALTSTQSNVTFGSIPNTFRDLIVVMRGTTSATEATFLSMNGSSSGSSLYMAGNGSSASSGGNSGRMDIGFQFSSQPFTIIAQIFDYSTSDKFKSVLAREDNPANQTVAWAARNQSTAAVTSLTISRSTGTFNSGTTFSLYGIAG